MNQDSKRGILSDLKDHFSNQAGTCSAACKETNDQACKKQGDSCTCKLNNPRIDDMEAGNCVHLSELY